MTHIISDIHGCFYTLEKLLGQIRNTDSDPQLVFVGDYVDRGLHSQKVVELMIQLQKEGAVCLRGNHDDVLDWLCNMQCETDLQTKIGSVPNVISVGAWWMVNGLFQTIKSYSSVTKNVPFDVMITIFTSSVPREHKEFFRGLKLFWENDTHFACHAYLAPGIDLPRTLNFLSTSRTMALLWDRFPAKHDQFLNDGPIASGVSCAPPVWDRIGVFGHTPIAYYGSVVPIKHGNLRLIDTGAFKGDHMTAYCCEEDLFIMEPTDPRDIEQGENQ